MGLGDEDVDELFDDDDDDESDDMDDKEMDEDFLLLGCIPHDSLSAARFDEASRSLSC